MLHIIINQQINDQCLTKQIIFAFLFSYTSENINIMAGKFVCHKLCFSNVVNKAVLPLVNSVLQHPELNETLPPLQSSPATK